jgi:hypothetical protein
LKNAGNQHVMNELDIAKIVAHNYLKTEIKTDKEGTND